MRLEPDHVTRTDLLDGAALALRTSATAVTINVCPRGCVCHAVRAPGSNVTIAPPTRAGAVPWNGESIRTEPVNHSAGPLAEGCEPLFVIFMM